MKKLSENGTMFLGTIEIAANAKRRVVTHSKVLQLFLSIRKLLLLSYNFLIAKKSTY